MGQEWKGRPIFVDGRLLARNWRTNSRQEPQQARRGHGNCAIPRTVPEAKAALRAARRVPRAPSPRPARRPPNPWKATARPKATTSRSDSIFHASRITYYFLWPKLKLFSPVTSSVSAVNPTMSASPPATRVIFCFHSALPCRHVGEQAADRGAQATPCRA